MSTKDKSLVQACTDMIQPWPNNWRSVRRLPRDVALGFLHPPSFRSGCCSDVPLHDSANPVEQRRLFFATLATHRLCRLRSLGSAYSRFQPVSYARRIHLYLARQPCHRIGSLFRHRSCTLCPPTIFRNPHNTGRSVLPRTGLLLEGLAHDGDGNCSDGPRAVVHVSLKSMNKIYRN